MRRTEQRSCHSRWFFHAAAIIGPVVYTGQTIGRVRMICSRRHQPKSIMELSTARLTTQEYLPHHLHHSHQTPGLSSLVSHDFPSHLLGWIFAAATYTRQCKQGCACHKKMTYHLNPDTNPSVKQHSTTNQSTT